MRTINLHATIALIVTLAIITIAAYALCAKVGI